MLRTRPVLVLQAESPAAAGVNDHIAADDSLVANVEERSDALAALWRAKVAKHIDRHSAARFQQTAQSPQKRFAKGAPCEAIATKQVDGDVVEPFMAHCHVREGVRQKNLHAAEREPTHRI